MVYIGSVTEREIKIINKYNKIMEEEKQECKELSPIAKNMDILGKNTTHVRKAITSLASRLFTIMRSGECEFYPDDIDDEEGDFTKLSERIRYAGENMGKALVEINDIIDRLEI